MPFLFSSPIVGIVDNGNVEICLFLQAMPSAGIRLRDHFVVYLAIFYFTKFI